MNNTNNTAYPTVATIIGCPEELKGADGLIATPIVSEEQVAMQSQAMVTKDLVEDIKDPVHRAVINNILGKVPTKAPQEKLKCDLCNVEVTAKAAMLTHLNGARHAKRVKEESLDTSNCPFIEYKQDKKIFYCRLCNATLNAKVQITAHLAGNKHRSKLGSEKLEECNNIINSDPAKPRVDATSNLLYCATCNINVNSETQLLQHTSSKKHINKVNGVVPSKRPVPYPVKKSMQGINKSVGRGGSMGGGVSERNGGGMSRGNMGGDGTIFHRRSTSAPYRLPYHDSSIYSLSNSFVSGGHYNPAPPPTYQTTHYRNTNHQYPNHNY